MIKVDETPKHKIYQAKYEGKLISILKCKATGLVSIPKFTYSETVKFLQTLK